MTEQVEPADEASTHHGDDDSDKESVGRQAASGVFWLTAQRWILRILSFASIAILTRFLSPEDFGTVAAASTVLPFFFLIADLGFAAYIVQAKEVNQRLLSTGFWFSALAGITLAGAAVAVAPLFGVTFGSEAVVPVLRVLSASVVFAAVGSIPTALLRRSMKFSILARQGAVAAVAAQVVAVGMTLLGFGVWALVGQTLTSSLIGTVLAWMSAKWRPSMQFDRADFSRMAHFGVQVLGVEAIAMVRQWAEASIISSVLGLQWLGYMNIAQRLVQIVQDLTGGAIVPVTTVAFAKIREGSARLLAAYIRALRMSYSALSLPLVYVAVSAPVLIPLAFGPGWGPSVQVAQVLAVAGTLTVAASLDHGLFYGKGRPGMWFWYAVVVDAITVGVTALTVRSGLIYVAAGFLVVSVLATIFRWFLVARLLDVKAKIIAAPFSLLVLLLVTVGAIGWLVSRLLTGAPPVVSAVGVGLAVLGVHLLVLRLAAPDVVRDARLLLEEPVRRRLGRLRRRAI